MAKIFPVSDDGEVYFVPILEGKSPYYITSILKQMKEVLILLLDVNVCKKVILSFYVSGNTIEFFL